jgi:UDP-N-acetylglucosamine acyltransferase
VAAGARLADDVEIGPFCIVGDGVTLGEGVRLISHVTVRGQTEIGARTMVHSHAALGEPPQDRRHKGEATRLVVGPDSVIREQVTMHLGTAAGRGETVVGAGGLFMVGAHVGHDCVVGDRVVFANNATLGGFVTIGDGVNLGGLSAIHQLGRVGRLAFVGGGAPVTGDVIPFGLVDNHGRLAGLNLIGLKRRGFSRGAIHTLRAAYRMLFEGDGQFETRVEAAATAFSDASEVQEIIAFIREDAHRSLCLPARR